MKFKHLLTATALMLSISVVAQPKTDAKENKEEGFKFETIKELPVTSVKNQNQAGTCWCYSSLAFFEAELLRMGKPEYDFSEMYIVYKTYLDRAEAAIRTHGDVSFSQGGSFGDVLYAIKNYGLVPDCEMPAGTMHGDSLSNFNELSAVTDPYVEGVIKSRKIQMDKDGNALWKKGLAGIYDAYLGVPPTEFTYNGKKYTPKSFAESTGLNMNDYVNLTSFTHHPFYEEFVIEVQDNWRWGRAWNLPIDELLPVHANCEDPGIVLKFLDIINTDPEAFNYLCFGIPGYHYTLDDNGNVVTSEENAGYDPNCDWAFGNQFLAHPRAGQSADNLVDAADNHPQQ